MFRYLILKSLELEEAADRMQEKFYKEHSDISYEDIPVIGNIEKWFEKETAIMEKADSLKREYRRKYRESLKRELLGGE